MKNYELENKKSGMLLFLAAEIMFFTGFIGAIVVLRRTVAVWPEVSKILNLPLEISSAAFLSVSSVLYALNFKTGRKSMLWLVWFLGVLFLAFRFFAVRNFQPSADLFSAFFFMVSCIHGFHVLAGVFCLAWFLKASKPVATLESFGLYWHFLALSWIVLLILLAVL